MNESPKNFKKFNESPKNSLKFGKNSEKLSENSKNSLKFGKNSKNSSNGIEKKNSSAKEKNLELPKTGKKIIEIEKSEIGSVKWSVYGVYLKANGYFLTFLVCLFYATANSFQVSANVWLADWSNDANKYKNETPPNTGERLAGYAGLGLGQGQNSIQNFTIFFNILIFYHFLGVFIMSGALTMAYAMVHASALLHKRLLHNILRSAMSFFDVTPLGRIINRFGKDIDVLDSTMVTIYYFFNDTNSIT